MTNQEIKTVGQTIAQETQIGGNTAARVGGVVEGIGVALDNKDAANDYYQATINGGTITVNAPNYLLGSGGNLRIKMPSAGTTASTLTIGNASNVQLWYNGATVSAQNTWEQGEIISVFYDGTRFMASNSQGGGGKAEKIKYDNSASGLAAENVQGALDNVGDELLKQSQIFYNKLSISSRTAGYFGPHKLGFQTGKKYKVVVTLQSTATANIGFYLSEAATSNVNGISFISVLAGYASASKIYNGDASHQYLYWWSGESVSNKFEISVYEIVEGALQDVYKNLELTNITSSNIINIAANQIQIHVNNPTNIISGHLYKVKVSLPYAATSNILINLSNKTGNRDRFLICQINVGETTSEFNFLSTDNTHVWLCTYSTQSISGVVVEFYDYSEFSAESITNLNDAIYGITNKYVFNVSAGSNTLNIDGLWDKEKLVLISTESDDITFGEAWFAMTYNGVEESGCLITYGIGDTGVYKFTDDCTYIKVWCSNVSGNGNLTIVIQDAGLDKKLPVRFGNISIIGDSYSTYKYWIPNNNPSWYCTNGIDGENAETNNVNSVMQTWWYKLCQELPATLLLNDSYSGAPICNYAYNADQTSKSFVTRMKSCLGEDKALLPKPDIIIIFGGTNDDWGDSVVGSVKYGNWITEDLNQVLPSVCYMFDYIKKWNPSAIIINVVNSGLDNSISDGMAAAAEHYNIYNLPLLGIGKTSQHPNISGMNAIKNQIISLIRKIIIGI